MPLVFGTEELFLPSAFRVEGLLCLWPFARQHFPCPRHFMPKDFSAFGFSHDRTLLGDLRLFSRRGSRLAFGFRATGLSLPSAFRAEGLLCLQFFARQDFPCSRHFAPKDFLFEREHLWLPAAVQCNAMQCYVMHIL